MHENTLSMFKNKDVSHQRHLNTIDFYLTQQSPLSVPELPLAYVKRSLRAKPFQMKMSFVHRFILVQVKLVFI